MTSLKTSEKNDVCVGELYKKGKKIIQIKKYIYYIIPPILIETFAYIRERRGKMHLQLTQDKRRTQRENREKKYNIHETITKKDLLL